MVEDTFIEFLELIAFILTLYLGEKTVEWLFGTVHLFGRFPITYLFDSGDASLVICFSVRACWRMFRSG